MRPSKARSDHSHLGSPARRKKALGLASLCALCLTAFIGIGASSAGAEDSCPNAEFRTGPSAKLPDCRAYEKVSPSEKFGLSVVPRGSMSVSLDGDRVVYSTRASGPGAGFGAPTPYLSSRDAAGVWSAHAIDPPGPPGAFRQPEFLAFDADLSHSVVVSYAALTPNATESAPQLYLRDDAPNPGGYQLITPLNQVQSPFVVRKPELGGVTPDTSHVAYVSSDPQTGDTVAPGTYNAYEWVDGETRLIGLIPPAGQDECGPAPLSACLPTANGSQIGSNLTFAGSAEHALSADGRRVVFHATEPGVPAGQGVQGQLYVRDDQGTTDSGDDTTEHITASQRTDCADHDPCSGDPEPDPSGPLQAFYWTAESTRGSKVLFTSCEKLTDNATAFVGGGTCSGAGGGFAAPGSDLYLYNVDDGHLADLTTEDPDGADVQGVVGASDDLDTIYFVAKGVLASGAAAGEPNLYLWHDGTTKLVARLDVTDEANWHSSNQVRFEASRVSPNGTAALFTSVAPLEASYDNANPTACPPKVTDPGPDGLFGTPDDVIGNPDGRCAEVYLYDAGANGGVGSLTCLSCDPSGARPAGDATLYGAGAAMLGFTPNPMPANLRKDGRRAFFESPDPLSPSEDSNGKVDVYQWEAGGVGSCANGDGCVNLISSGSGGSDSHFADASPSGDDVFFTTYQRLALADADAFADLYDARVGGGLASQQAVPPPRCSGDGCQGGPTPPPTEFGSGSSSFSGPGNRGRDRGATAIKKQKRKACKRIHDKRKRKKCIKKNRESRKHRRANRKHRRAK